MRLRVVDNGVGISPEARAHLFEPFFTTKDVGKGTGLGLASVYGIVRQSNGFIAVESEPGRGHDLHDALSGVRVARRGADAPPASRRAAGRGRETILLVEDEDAVRAIISAVLRRQGYQVLEASTPRAACEIFARARDDIDLLLTDVVMPEMNGPALAQRLIGLRPGAARAVHLGLRRHAGAAGRRQPERRLPEQAVPGVGADVARARDAGPAATAGRRER